MLFRTAAPMTVKGPREGEPSSRSMRNGLRIQPAHLVRGSSRRIMTMRFRPANIRVINRRVCSLAVIGTAVRTETLRAHQQERVPACAAHRRSWWMPERCSPSRVRSAAHSAPLPAVRRSGSRAMRWAAPAGTLPGPSATKEEACFLLAEKAGLAYKNYQTVSTSKRY
jgi:hypothetical protein